MTRSSTSPDDVTARRASVIGPLDPRSVAMLTVARGYPCLSILMPTTPGPRMTADDAGRLAGLLHDAKRQLEDQGVLDGARLLVELERLARVARQSRTDLALGLFVNRSLSRGWTLPTTVQAKAVVEATFATRDLLRAVHRTPPHLVVRLGAFGARIFWMSGGATLIGSVERVTAGSHHPAAPADDRTSREDRADFLSRVDTALGRLRRERPSPLVLAGDPELVAGLKARGRWLDRLAGEVHPPDADEPASLFGAAAAQLEDYLHRRGRQTLSALMHAAAKAPTRVACGLDDCWTAVTSSTPGTLVVEHGYVHPRPPGRAGEPPAHDLVDDLLELALERGNLIAFVEDGELQEFGGIALLRTG